MKDFILKSSDFEIREQNNGEEYIDLAWSIKKSPELLEELKSLGLKKRMKTIRVDETGEKIAD